jgi:hypothetical protein
MDHESNTPRTLTWILTSILVLCPFLVSLATAVPFTAAINPAYVAPFPMVLDAVLSSAPLPSAFLSIILVSLNSLPVLRKSNRLPLPIALALAIFLSILSLLAAGLSPLYAHLRAAFTCYGHIGLQVLFAPASWVYYVSGLSVALAMLIAVRVYKELRAA